MRLSRLLTAGLVVLVLSGTNAFAQATISPFTGVTFGGDTDENRFVYGAVLGLGGNFGLDIDFGYAPNFFSDTDEFADFDGKLNITTLMFNIRIGGSPERSGGGPFISGGVGLMRGSVSSPGDLFDQVSRNDFALNVGGGLQGFFNEHVGMRGDLRYFRNLTGDREGGFILDPREFDLGEFTFWRATVALTFRF
jgi:opacity protein-like surface antigen